MEIVWKLDARELVAMLELMERYHRGQEPLMLSVMSRVGIAAMTDIQLDFIKLSGGARVRGTQWKQLSPITAMFRRRGRGGKIANMADARKRAAMLPILRDEGRLHASLSPGMPANIFQVETMRVTVGTNDSRAAKLHSGGTTTFEWDEGKAKRFDQNVRKTLSGPKPRTTLTGKVSRATHHWNPFYFQMRNFFAGKGNGKTYKVPARPIIAEKPSQAQADHYAAIIRDGIENILRGGGGAAGS